MFNYRTSLIMEAFDSPETSIHIQQTIRRHILKDSMVQTFLCYVTYIRILKKINESIKEQILSVGRIFLPTVGRHASVRAIIAPIHCHTRTHHAVSCQGNKKEAPSVLLWLAPGCLGAEWQQVAGWQAGRHCSLLSRSSARPQHITSTCSCLLSDTHSLL